MFAKDFGQRLRYYRERRIDPTTSPAENDRGRLTQAHFGELVGQKLGLDSGYTGAAVSEWELGKSAVHAHDRPLLLAIVAVLKEQGRLLTPSEADELLAAGGYRPLDSSERAQVFPDQPDSENSPRPTKFISHASAVFHRWSEMFKRSPQSWLEWIGARTRQVTAGDALRAALGALAWWATAWMLSRCLNWPYTDSAHAVEAALTWAVVNLIVPLIVGALARPWARPEWQARPAAHGWLLRAYAFQGAWIGYQVAALSLFGATLFSYHAGLHALVRPIRPLLDISLALCPLSFGYAAAHAVPENLWRAYGRLSWGDGGVFFIFAALAPAWAAFFYWQADFLLTPFWGMLTLLLAFIGAPALAAWQERRTGSTITPVHVWIVIYGLMLMAALFQLHGDVLEIVILGGQILLLACLSLWGQLRATLSGALTFAALLAFVWLVAVINVEIGRWVALLALGVWMWKGRRRFWMPISMWLLALAGVGLSALVRQQVLDSLPALAVYLALLALLLLWHYRQRRP